MFGSRVGDSQSATHGELGQPERYEELDHHRGCAAEKIGVENVRPNVEVHTHQIDGGGPPAAVDRTQRITVGEVEAEFRVVLTRGNVFVRVRVDPRGHPHLHPHATASGGRDLLDTVDLVEVVDNDVPDTLANRVAQFVVGLVVSVHHASVGRYARGKGAVEVGTRGDVEHQALVVCKTCHRLAEKCLRCVNDIAFTERCDRLAAPVAQMLFVVDEKGRPEFAGEVVQAAATDRQAAVGLDRRRVGQQSHFDRRAAHIASGASMPNNPNPVDITRAVASHKASRLVRVGSEDLSTGQFS